MKNNKAVVMEAVKQNGNALELAGESMRNDKAVVMEAVKQDPYALRFAGDALKNDKDVVMEAVKQDPLALEYAGETVLELVNMRVPHNYSDLTKKEQIQILMEVFENQPTVSKSVLPKPVASSPPPIGKPCNPKNKKSKLPEYVCNPKTGRWVKRTGAIGIEVVKKYGL